MPEVEVLLPKMGESVAEATIIKWLKKEGDAIEMDEPFVEIATDKVDSEVPAPEDGVLVKMLCEEGDVIEVGKPIALISTGKADSAPTPGLKPEGHNTASSNGTTLQAAPPKQEAETSQNHATEKVSKAGPSGRFYSPLVRNIAQQEGIGMAELEQIEGSGMEGRVTKKDILGYIPHKGQNGSTKEQSTVAPASPPPATARDRPQPKSDKRRCR